MPWLAATDVLRWWADLQAWASHHETLVGAALHSLAAVMGVAVAAIAILAAQRLSRQARRQLVDDERQAAALLLWAEVRRIQRGC